ncbi:PAS domain-containing protein [Hymenobacter sp. BRD67]|uniref:PAS domain-containing protein n=1 Tax=Hymenobacter sp. BRD67 TaxID=2675877 RepID=UPI0015661CAB|nr:PAS domain-containing protein [Hymenobacter sp. BRD67]QKG52836.1 PAS domain-containing protein [Hymenobacter sp. BRD67]
MPTPALPVDYQQLFRALPENFLLMAPDSTILDNTNSHEAVSMKPRAAVLGRTLFEAYPSVDKNEGDVIFQSHEHVRNFLEPHAMPVIRYDLERPAEQGGGFEESYWQATHYPLLTPDGKLQYILQRTQNVTQQLRNAQATADAQQKLADEQERTRFVLANLPVLIWTATPDGQRDFFNSRWLSFTGKELADQQGYQWLNDLHPDDQERVRTQWQQAVKNGTPYQVEYRLRRHDGQYRWILARAQARRDANDQITMWVGGATDIHDQKMLVQEILEANEQQALLSEQAYQNYQRAESQRATYHGLFMQAPALICILRGPEHRFEFVNTAYQSLFPDRQLVGRPLQEALPEVSRQGILELLNGVYQTGKTYIGNEVPLQLQLHEGSPEMRQGYFNFTYQQFKELGQVAGIMVFAFEVTELVAARKAQE